MGRRYSSRMNRLVLLALLVLAGAPPAFAQDDAFGPLPPAAPTVTPTPESANQLDDDDVGRATLYGIGGVLLVAFAGLALWITRDARRAVPEVAHRQEPLAVPERDPRSREQVRKARAKARKKARTARASRKRNR